MLLFIDKAKLLNRQAELGLSDSELAKRSGITPYAIYKIVNLNRRAQVKTAGKLAQALGLAPYELIEA